MTDFRECVKVNSMNKTKRLYSPKEYSRITGIPLSQVYYWLKTGRLEAMQRVKGGCYYISELEIPTFLRKKEEADNPKPLTEAWLKRELKVLREYSRVLREVKELIDDFIED